MLQQFGQLPKSASDPSFINVSSNAISAQTIMPATLEKFGFKVSLIASNQQWCLKLHCAVVQ